MQFRLVAVIDIHFVLGYLSDVAVRICTLLTAMPEALNFFLWFSTIQFLCVARIWYGLLEKWIKMSVSSAHFSFLPEGYYMSIIRKTCYGICNGIFNTMMWINYIRYVVYIVDSFFKFDTVIWYKNVPSICSCIADSVRKKKEI